MYSVFTKAKKNLSLTLLYLIVFIPVITMCYFLISDYSHLEEEEIKKNEQIATVLTENLDSYLRNVKATLISVSNLSALQRGDRSEIEKIFQNLILADNQVSLFWTVDLNGKVLAKYPNTWLDRSNDQQYIQEVLKTQYILVNHVKVKCPA